MPPDTALPIDLVLPLMPAAAVEARICPPSTCLDPCGILLAIRAAAEDAAAFTTGLDATALAVTLETDRRTGRAIQSALAEIAVLAAALPADLRARHPAVDWRGWIGLPALLTPAVLQHEGARLRMSLDADLPSLLAAVEAELRTSMKAG